MTNLKLKACLGLACVALGSATANAGEEPSVADLAQMSPQSVHQAQEDGVDMKRISALSGVHILSLDESPYVGLLAEQIRRELAEQEASGAASVSAAEVRDLRKESRRIRRSTVEGRNGGTFGRSISDIRSQLHYEPISISGSVLDGVPLTDIATSGGLQDGRWTGTMRSWDVPALGFIELSEYEYKGGGGSITLVKETLNVDIHGYPGALKVSRSDDGVTILSLGWVTDRSVYRLDLQPLDHQQVQANRDALLAVARALGGAADD
ncbi:MAG: hypothetical protein GAK28_03713 [Luteibacter sp.]|uniref:hypothetical protein n=1 Tax=Luteibacter sp. TaxID=1886636 RepID=UPI00138127AA|nr:hypothetical protein [Luteibacter sp.]KAF1004879.1 MAG: hypothetical protein GAK28_03713 [Luteibacter sp.]